MKKVVRFNENDIENLVKKIMNESAEGHLDMEFSRLVDSVGDEKKIEQLTKKFNSLKGADQKKKAIENLRRVLKTSKPIKENERPRGGMMFGPKAEIVDGVVNRIGEYGDEYIGALEELNEQFPVTKYKTIEPPRKIEVPAGVKVRSTVYPTNEGLFDFLKGKKKEDSHNAIVKDLYGKKKDVYGLDVNCRNCGANQYEKDAKGDFVCSHCGTVEKTMAPVMSKNKQYTSYRDKMKDKVARAKGYSGSDGGDGGPR